MRRIHSSPPFRAGTGHQYRGIPCDRYRRTRPASVSPRRHCTPRHRRPSGHSNAVPQPRRYQTPHCGDQYRRSMTSPRYCPMHGPEKTAGIKATRDLPSVVRMRAHNCGKPAVNIAGRHVSIDIAQTGMPAGPVVDISARETPCRSAVPGCRGVRYRYRIHGVRPYIDAGARVRLI